MPTIDRPYLRLHREPSVLGSYTRPLERDYRHVGELIAAGFKAGSGMIIDACDPDRSKDLRAAGKERGLEVVLDPRSIELATAGGVQRSGVLDLPWSLGRVQVPSDFSAEGITRYSAALTETAISMGVSAVLAPAHYLESELTPWFDLDVALTCALRARLDEDSVGRRIRIYYPLASVLSSLQPGPVLSRVIDVLRELARARVVDAVWLRMHNFGTNAAGPVTLLRYIRLARAMHGTGVPVVAERTGTVGIPLMALGAVAGIESGITHGERFNFRELKAVRKEPPTGGFAHRVYLPAIGAYLKREAAAKLLNTRGMKGSFGCQRECCPRGVADMVSEPRRHFLVSRSQEVLELQSVPLSMRVEHYFSSWLRHAADRAARAARVIDSLDEHEKRLGMWRATLSTQVDLDLREPPSVSATLEFGPDRHRGTA